MRVCVTHPVRSVVCVQFYSLGELRCFEVKNLPLNVLATLNVNCQSNQASVLVCNFPLNYRCKYKLLHLYVSQALLYYIYCCLCIDMYMFVFHHSFQRATMPNLTGIV